MSHGPIVLVLVKGHPGVGKSTLARSICQELGWALIDKDDARDCLQTLPAELLQRMDANQLAYDIMFQYCATQLSLGLSVVLDCPFARVALYDKAVEIAELHGATVAVVDCIASNTETWKQQLEARGRMQQDAAQAHKPKTWPELQQLLDRYAGCWKWPTDGSRALQHYCLVDTTGAAEQQVLQFLRGVRVQKAPDPEQQPLAPVPVPEHS